MRRLFFALLTVSVALAVGMGGMGVTAQETPTNETDAEDELDDDLGDEYDQVIDADTRVVEWSYDSGLFTVVVEADEDTEIGITEAGGFSEGSGSYNFETVEIDEGESTVTFSTRDANGAAVTISTQDSLAQGTGAYLSTGTDVEENPFRHFGGESGLFSGVAMTTLLAGIGAGYVVRSENKGVIER